MSSPATWRRIRPSGDSTVAQTVLVIDDNLLMRKLVRITLAAEGYVVPEASDGRSGIEALVEHTPDLVIQDLILPDMSGTELIRRLRALPAGAEIPILAVSGFGAMTTVAENARLGFTEVLRKPIEPSRLIAIVGKYLAPQIVEPALPMRSAPA